MARKENFKHKQCPLPLGFLSPTPTLHLVSASSLLLLSGSVVSDSLRPHGLQHARPPCPSLSPGVCSNSRPLSRWCHLTISFSVISFSSFLQSFPASGSFPMSELFASGAQSIGAFSFSISPPNEYAGLISFRIDWFDLLASKRLSRVFSNTTI